MIIEKPPVLESGCAALERLFSKGICSVLGEFHMNNQLRLRPYLLLLPLFLFTACRAVFPSEAEPTAPPLIIPTAPGQVQSSPVQSPAELSPTPVPPTPENPPIIEEVSSSPEEASPEATPTLLPEDNRYHVAFVVSDDTLNVRAGAGVDNEVVGELPPDADKVEITGAGQVVAGSTWFPIQAGELSGWVNGRYLSQNAVNFCQEEAVKQLLADLETAVANNDGQLLAQLIHPERGLRVRLNWWNPEVRFTTENAQNLFVSLNSYQWGIQTGSGQEISGTFQDVVLPLLQADLLGSEERACNELLAGPTAGALRLPDGYDKLNYYAYFRPPTDENIGFDWGTWVVGIERWGGQYYLSFLVHYAYEI